MKYDCLIVDDEMELAHATSEYFDMFGISARVTANASKCMELIREHTFGVILLDINLGNESGFNLCKEIRRDTDIPILFISARQSDDDVLIALNIGGDDYIKKPYSLSVLLAKVKVVLKRYQNLDPVNHEENSHIQVDRNARKVYVEGKDILLKTKEFNLFLYLYDNKNKVLTKDELFRKVWGDQFFSDGTLNVHIRKIREKFEADPNEPMHIKTVWGTGYIYED